MKELTEDQIENLCDELKYNLIDLLNNKDDESYDRVKRTRLVITKISDTIMLAGSEEVRR